MIPSQPISKNKEETTIERQNPCRFRSKNLVDDVPVHGDSHASSSHEVSGEPASKRREDVGKHSVYTHFPEDRNCETSVKRPKLQGPRAEDAMAESYLVQKILVT